MSPSVRHFTRHYIEMIVAMVLGMVVLGLPAEWALRAAGSSSHRLMTDAPAIAFLGMATMMTVPMLGWMRYRGHGRRANAEMAASMFLPSLGAIVLLATDALADAGAAMVLEHAVMLPAMLVAMLLRLDEYTGAHHHHGTAQEATA
jgi:hypothetical protein